VFIIMQEHRKQMERFFKEWENKVMVKSFPVLLDENQIKKLEKEIDIEGD